MLTLQHLHANLASMSIITMLVTIRVTILRLL